jgi:PAS domain S-box-containing protein
MDRKTRSLGSGLFSPLTLAMVGTVLTALFFQAWVLYQGYNRALRFIEVRAANRAQATAHQVENMIQQVDLMLLDLRGHLDPREIGGDPARRSVQRAKVVQQLIKERIARVPQILLMHVIAADGRYWYSCLDEVPKVGTADRRYFQRQRDAPQDSLVISEPLVGRVSKHWAIFLTRRIVTSDGRFAGILLATVDTETLGAVMETVDRQQWVLALHDQESRLISRWPAKPELFGKPLVDARLNQLSRTERVGFIGPGLAEKEAFIWAAQKMESTPMFTVVGYSKARALSQWHSDLRIHLAVAVLLVGGCVAVLALQARKSAAQQALKASEAYYRTLFDLSPEAIGVVSDQRLVDANQRYRELFLVSADNHTPPWDLAPLTQPDGSSSLEKGARLRAAALGGAVQRDSWQCQRSDGSLFEAEFCVQLFRHEGCDVLVAVVRDLTAIRAMEEKLHQAQKLDALGQLAGGVAHDFNNMLAAILMSGQLIADEAADSELRKLADTIVAAAERAGQLTKKLLAFARKGKILSSPTDIHQIINETVTMLERTIDRRIRVVKRLAAAHATVVADPSQIQNVLLNLGVNARDAMPDGGEITYASELVAIPEAQCRLGAFVVQPGDYLHVSVGDTGCGIPKAHLQRIFDPFFTTKEVDKGTGLGLAAVFGTMGSHKGAVMVESEEGKGSVFHLYLPLAAAQELDIREPLAVLPPGSGTILLIDDEDFVRTSAAMMIEAMGYTVVAEGDAKVAVEVFRSKHHELAAVLLDMVMPGISGTEVAARLKAIDPAVPVVLISGFPRSAQVNQLLADGVAGFLQKPFTRYDLGQLLLKVTRGRVAEDSPAI